MFSKSRRSEQPSPLTCPSDLPFVEWAQQIREKRRAEFIPGADDVLRRLDRVNAARNRLETRRGRRYANCRFRNYTITCSHQKTVVEKLKAYADASGKAVAAGRNIVLFGPKGTGKDHMLMALAYECAYRSGICTTWVNGLDLFDELRAEATGGQNLEQSYVTSDVLWISDPIPPTGVLTEFQQAALLKLIDKRYSDLKPCWVSLNAASAEDAERRMGAQVVDRLRDGALRCCCSWPSYRVQES